MNNTTWNYRVVRDIDPYNRERYSIHEVYYKGEKPITMTETPVVLSKESIDDLREEIDRMIDALNKPVLDHSDLNPIE